MNTSKQLTVAVTISAVIEIHEIDNHDGEGPNVLYDFDATVGAVGVSSGSEYFSSEATAYLAACKAVRAYAEKQQIRADADAVRFNAKQASRAKAARFRAALQG